MAVWKVLGRVWIPLVVLLVIGIGWSVVSDLRGAFGSRERPSYSGFYTEESGTSTPKQLTYEVFGPAGTVADISYFDSNSQPQQVEGAPLPWSMTRTSDSPAVIGSIVAQGNDNSIGCRIVVNGDVKVERTSNEVKAFTHCLLAAG